MNTDKPIETTKVMNAAEWAADLLIESYVDTLRIASTCEVSNMPIKAKEKFAEAADIKRRIIDAMVR